MCALPILGLAGVDDSKDRSRSWPERNCATSANQNVVGGQDKSRGCLKQLWQGGGAPPPAERPLTFHFSATRQLRPTVAAAPLSRLYAMKLPRDKGLSRLHLASVFTRFRRDKSACQGVDPPSRKRYGGHGGEVIDRSEDRRAGKESRA